MDQKEYQSGNASLVLVIIFIIALLITLGVLFWRNSFIKSKSVALSKTSSTIVKKSDTPKEATTGWTTYANKIKGITSFKYPSDWTVSDIYPNNQGVTLESFDFLAKNGYLNIIEGSAVTIAVNDTDLIDDDETLISDAMSISNSNNIDDNALFDINGERAIRFTFSSGEEQNNQLAILFYRNGQKYEFIQQYKFGSDNPYPDLLNNIILSIKF